MSSNPISRSSLVDAAANRMREEIAAGRWKLGERIPTEPCLAEMLQVSRGTIREAVKTLAVAGQLEVRQGAGTYVRSVSDPADTLLRLRRASLRDNFEVRCALEVEAARLAALRCTGEGIERLRVFLDARGSWSDEEGKQSFIEGDLAFHLALVAEARNPALDGLYRWFSAAVSDTIAATTEEDLPEPDTAAHRAVIDAIATGNPELAERAVRNFMAPILAELDRLLKP